MYLKSGIPFFKKGSGEVSLICRGKLTGELLGPQQQRYNFPCLSVLILWPDSPCLTEISKFYIIMFCYWPVCRKTDTYNVSVLNKPWLQMHLQNLHTSCKISNISDYLNFELSLILFWNHILQFDLKTALQTNLKTKTNNSLFSPPT